MLARQVRDQLDGLGATKTRIVVSGDLDEFAIAALRAEPVDIYGVGTSVVTGSGAPTAGMVYKLVEVDGMPVEKRSSHKESHGGRKQALRLAKHIGHHRRGDRPSVRASRRPDSRAGRRPSRSTLVRDGEPVGDLSLDAARERVKDGLQQPAVGRPETLPRRTGHPDPHGRRRRQSA